MPKKLCKISHLTTCHTVYSIILGSSQKRHERISAKSTQTLNTFSESARERRDPIPVSMCATVYLLITQSTWTKEEEAEAEREALSAVEVERERNRAFSMLNLVLHLRSHF